ncbi:hypothetical protein N665_0024s0023 [Sinapis alba]|nr:hypothetical protein N665_0024s0023 [Sinapis alba]
MKQSFNQGPRRRSQQETKTGLYGQAVQCAVEEVSTQPTILTKLFARSIDLSKIYKEREFCGLIALHVTRIGRSTK